MCFSCRFLPIKEVNQKLPQMTFIRLKTRHFRTKKDIRCWYKIVNILRLCCYQMSNPTIWRFTADNFNHNVLVASSFVKRRKLIYTPMYYQYAIYLGLLIPPCVNDSGYWGAILTLTIHILFSLHWHEETNRKDQFMFYIIPVSISIYDIIYVENKWIDLI